MEFIYEANRIYSKSESGSVIAEITFPAESPGVVNIDHTFVDPSLRGQGIAGKLVGSAADFIRLKGWKTVVTCSYAKEWFAKHPEYEDILFSS